MSVRVTHLQGIYHDERFALTRDRHFFNPKRLTNLVQDCSFHALSPPQDEVPVRLPTGCTPGKRSSVR